MILYAEQHWLSPYVFPVFVGLHEKGVRFETREIDVDRGAHLDPDFVARSLTAKIPVVEEGGFVLAESIAIVEWLEDRFVPPDHPRLLGETMQERARVRQVIAWLRSDLMKLREDRSTVTMFYDRATGPLSPGGRADADKLFAVADRVLPRDAATLVSKFSLADAELSFMLHRLILNGDAVPDRLRAYAVAHFARPSIRAFVEHARAPRA